MATKIVFLNFHGNKEVPKCFKNSKDNLNDFIPYFNIYCSIFIYILCLIILVTSNKQKPAKNKKINISI